MADRVTYKITVTDAPGGKLVFLNQNEDVKKSVERAIGFGTGFFMEREGLKFIFAPGFIVAAVIEEKR